MLQESRDRCWCGSRKYNLLGEKTWAGFRFIYHTCQSCGTTYMANPLTDESLDLHYKDDYKNRIQLSFDQKVYDASKTDYMLMQKYLPMQTFNTFMDFGCNLGGFVRLMIEHGYASIGVDIGDYLRYCNRKGIPAVGSIEEVPMEIDVISAISVFEHLKDPVEIFKSFHALQPHYVVAIIPVYDKKEQILVPAFSNPTPQHLWFWTNKSFAAFAKHCGFEVIACEEKVHGEDWNMFFCLNTQRRKAL